MAVLDRSELEASPLSDLHAIADQLGLEGFRRMRKAELIDAILGERPGGDGVAAQAETEESAPPPRRRRGGRLRRLRSGGAEGEEEAAQREPPAADGEHPADEREHPAQGEHPAEEGEPAAEQRTRTREDEEPAAEGGAGESATEPRPRASSGARTAEGVVEVLGNGSAFLRVDPAEPSDADVYISAAQVRRCELVSGDRVSGPVRTARRSERYPSLVRVEEINGVAAEAVSGGTRYEELPVDYPRERLALGSADPTLEAIEWLTPLGRGSRAVIAGGRQAGKTETLRRLLGALHGRDDLSVSLVLAGVRPEEIESWREGPVAPASALTFAASADSQDQAVERVLDTARRVASRGGDAVVLIDSLDGLHPHAARKALAAARNLREAGSVTVIATAARPFGGESTVIALDVNLTQTGRQPNLDLVGSGTLRSELLVGEEGAQAIMRARAAALDSAG
jgi:transcription termination factor Rho